MPCACLICIFVLVSHSPAIEAPKLTHFAMVVVFLPAEESARFRLGRMLEKLTQLERKMINVEARLSSVADPPAL